jgi:hypothetical protein
MSRSLCLSAISSLALALAAPACSDTASCGSPGSAEFGLAVSSDQLSLIYGGLRSGANNDCPDPAAPAGIVSLTVTGSQMGGTGLITLCIPRPDQLSTTGALGTSVKIVDLTGTDTAACTYAYDSFHPPTGTVHGVGVCANGSDKSGFGLVFDGFLGLKRTCAGTTDSVSVGITGDVAVTPL